MGGEGRAAYGGGECGRDSRKARGWRGVLLVVTLVFGASGCATVPTEYREPPPLAAEERTALNAEVFDRAWELVDENYFDASFRGVDWAAMRGRYRPDAVRAKNDEELYGVLNAMAAELKESHLVALSPRRAHERRQDHRALIGVRWEKIGDARVVTDVVPGGPADEAGIRTGWLVVSRNGAPMPDGRDAFVARLGEKVTYGFIDEEERLRRFVLEPRLLNFARLEAGPLVDEWVYLRFDRFSWETVRWLSRELKRHETAPGVVVDLRYNSGGDTFSLRLAIAEFFDERMAEGAMVSRDGRMKEAHSFGWLSAQYGGRVLLLVGPETGSAAEIFSHVLQHHERATVMGRRTAGAVISSRYYRLPRGGELQVPILDYVGLDGERLEGRGVTPDIEVAKPTLADRRANRDGELERAVEWVRGRSGE